MSRYISFRDFDWVLLVLVLLICSLGVVEIYSATLSTKFMGVHLKQVYWILGGVGADVRGERSSTIRRCWNVCRCCT